ncbi:MAG TPA: Gfo/Idh/MocA family oxidoreductase [Lacunisphaera sp.]|nr:Gfo/Idh/MocA family oxidoreductase [Lacunisphaera sp.]
MGSTLRAMVLGAGFAGQGHARALRACGVEVVAMAARTDSVVRQVAESLQIPVATTDWRRTMRELRPDIVAVATPGGTHVEMTLAALDLGCHIFMDKPLATTAADAERLYRRAAEAGVKTAYAASYRYQPAVLFAAELVRAGEIGAVREVECVSHYHWPALASFGWPHRLETGGGRLNNNFSHKLAIALAVTGGTVLAATGETRNDLRWAPVGPPSHDFRAFTQAALAPEQAARCEWREVDSDWAYTVLARLGPAGGRPADGISATFRHSALRLGRLSDYVAFYGEGGTIHIEGAYAQGPLFHGRSRQDWRERPVPRRIVDRLPAIADDTERNWTQLAREFVADLRGEGDSGYLKFREGWMFQAVIDAARQSSGWTAIP